MGNFNKTAVMVFFVALLALGCISQTYYHKINPDGSSTISQTTDYAKVIASETENGKNSQKLLDSAELAFARVCSTTKMECRYDESSITLTDTANQRNDFYEFESAQSLFGSSYKITINKIPRQKFDSALQKGRDALDKSLIGDAEKEIVPDLDLNDREGNAQLARDLKNNNADAMYVVEFPVAITSATSGNYSARIKGNIAEFDMAAVLSDSSPITIEGSESNPSLLVMAILGIALIYIWMTFMKQRKTRKR